MSDEHLTGMTESDGASLRDLKASLGAMAERQRQMEERLALLEAGGVPVSTMGVAPPPIQAAAAPQRDPSRGAMETRVGLTLINRVGVVTLILGVAFFFKWAVDNNWIGPWSRVLLGIIGGLTALLIAEVLFRKSQEVFAQGITATGIAIVYVAVYSAYGFYSLIGQAAAFVALTAVTALAVALALHYKSEAIAAFGFLGGYLVPMLVTNGVDRPWFLLCFVFLLSAAALGLARGRSWLGLELLSTAASGLIFMIWWLNTGDRAGDILPGLCFSLIYFAMFLVVSNGDTPALATVMAAAEGALFYHSHPRLSIALLLLFAVAAFCRYNYAHRVTLYLSANAAVLTGLVLEILHRTSRLPPASRASVTELSLSLALAVYAVAVICIGVLRRVSIHRVLGLVLIAFVIAKLYLVDLWQLGRIYRISAFVALGLLLISTSFLYSRFRSVMEAFLTDDSR